MLVAALIVAAAIAATVLWRLSDTHGGQAQVLGPRMGGFGIVSDPVPVKSATMQIGFMAPYEGKEDPETLTFQSATAHFQRNTSDAVATISVCLPRDTPNGNLGGGGAVHAPTLDEYCLKSRQVTPGTTLRWGTELMEGEFLVLTVRPRKPGVAEVGSFTFEYTRDKAHGGKSGAERLTDQEFVAQAS